LETTEGGRYIFSAYANSVGAVLREPLKAFLSDVPCAALPVTGGLISQVKENLSFKIESSNILTIGRASATVLGEYRKGNKYISLATSTVEKLNILDVVTADAIVSKITSVYTDDGKSPHKGENSHFVLRGSHFDNLRVEGQLIQCQQVDSQFKPKEELGFGVKDTNDFYFSKTKNDGDCQQTIRIPQFGTIYLGQVKGYSSKVILTMLRVELGCPFEARAALATASTNGSIGL